VVVVLFWLCGIGGNGSGGGDEGSGGGDEGSGGTVSITTILVVGQYLEL